MEYIGQIIRVDVWQAQLFLIDSPFDNENILAPLPEEGGNYEKIQTIPYEIVAFKRLQHLVFADQFIQTIPSYIGQLDAMKALLPWCKVLPNGELLF